MKFRPAVLGSSVLIGLALVAAPTAASAATVSDAPSSTSASTSSTGVIGQITQEHVQFGSHSVIQVVVPVSTYTAVALVDDRGRDVAQSPRWANPGNPAKFFVSPTGQTEATFHVAASNEVRDVTVHFGAAQLDQPLDVTSAGDLAKIRLALLKGQDSGTLTYSGVVGAEIELTVNGVRTSAVVGADGTARVEASFRKGYNEISATQSLNGNTSPAASYQYNF